MSIDWSKVASGVATAVNLVAPAVELIAPETTVAIEVAKRIIVGAAAAEPAAVALYNQIIGGQTPTADDIKAYIVDNDNANQELHDEIAKQVLAAAAAV